MRAGASPFASNKDTTGRVLGRGGCRGVSSLTDEASSTLIISSAVNHPTRDVIIPVTSRGVCCPPRAPLLPPLTRETWKAFSKVYLCTNDARWLTRRPDALRYNFANVQRLPLHVNCACIKPPIVSCIIMIRYPVDRPR